MSLLTLLTAMNLFFGEPSSEVEYRLMEPGWYELDTSGIDWMVSHIPAEDEV